MGVNEQSLRKIVREVVSEAIEPLQENVRGLKEDVSTLKEDVSTLKEDVSTLKEDVSTLKEDVSTLKEDVSTLKGSVIVIEQTMTSYADSYKINQHNIERVDSRLTTVEEKLDIEPPEELKVPHSGHNGW